ncbi:uncharacterized protein LOC122381818 isoform X2 [Amphibalanus amphitrite]|nr:uncharacterized protein LOC122381818 isoform X2 [Amphibalanus amphitrite]XP_043222434.1 uncharacterized protein LOC122381818 isoform X2 [Amphibalanus amphitrite]XP_043222435.1 uncharacterized protein LOC122381818 isoform X2 [Amphibalanus amphitrite]
MYRVVAFIDEDEVAVVSSRWWRSTGDGDRRGEVRWPPSKTDAAKNRLLEKSAAPDHTWSTHPARTLFITDDLKKARCKERQAEMESDLNSESEKENIAQRNRRKNARYDEYLQESIDDSDDDASSLGPRVRGRLAKPPAAPDFSVAGAHRSGGISSPGPSGAVARSPIGITNASTSSQPRRVDDDGLPAQPPSTPTGQLRSQCRQALVELTPLSSARPSVENSEKLAVCDGCAATRKMNRQLLLMMGKVLKAVETMDGAVRQNTAAIQSMGGGGERPTGQRTLQTMEDFEELAVRLKDRGAFNNLVDQLSGWCSMAAADLDRNVRMVMRALIAPCLAERLSLKGRNGKRAVEGTEVYEAIFAVLRRCGGADRQKVGTAVGKWLSGSRDRNGKRLLRAKNSAAGSQNAAASPPSPQPSPPPPQPQQQELADEGELDVLVAGLGLARPAEGQVLPADEF